MAQNEPSALSQATTKFIDDQIDVINEGTQAVDLVNVYRTVVDEVERPMLSRMMMYCRGNQSHAAICLGINRATLRTKLKRHNLL